MLPVAKLNAKFLSEELIKTMNAIKHSSGKLKAIICDGIVQTKLALDNLKQLKVNHG